MVGIYDWSVSNILVTHSKISFVSFYSAIFYQNKDSPFYFPILDNISGRINLLITSIKSIEGTNRISAVIDDI